MPAYFTLSWGEEEAAGSRLPVGLPLLAPFLCFSTPSRLSVVSWQPYPMAFQAVQQYKRAFVVAGVLYLYAVRSITAAAYI